MSPRPLEVEVSASGNLGPKQHADTQGHAFQLHRALGTRSNEFALVAVNSLKWAGVSRGHMENQDQGEIALNAALAFIDAIAPENELETALAIQMNGLHALTTEMLGRARQADGIETMQAYAGMAVKLQKRFTESVDTLSRLRSGGKQQVIVKHVYINGNAVVGDGTQAVFGDATGGVRSGSEHQSHAHGAAAVVDAPLLGQDAPGHALPGTGDAGAVQMQDARREGGRANGREERQIHARPANEGDENAS